MNTEDRTTRVVTREECVRLINLHGIVSARVSDRYIIFRVKQVTDQSICEYDLYIRIQKDDVIKEYK